MNFIDTGRMGAAQCPGPLDGGGQTRRNPGMAATDRGAGRLYDRG